MQRQNGRAGAPQLRKMFLKVIKDGSATFDARRDGPRFIRAALEFQDDPVDLLYCLTNEQVPVLDRLLLRTAWQQPCG